MLKIECRLKVLNLLGLANIVTTSSPHIGRWEDRKFDGELLGASDLLAGWEEKYGQPASGIKRTHLNLALEDALVEAGMPVLSGWKLKEIIETENGATAIAEDGRKEKGSFLIGCDGIKSVVRRLVLKGHSIEEGEAEFTGLTQVCIFRSMRRRNWC